MKYLIRFVQVHETFRVPEITALAVLHGIDIDIVHYDPKSPFCLVELASEQAARALLQRSILAYDIYELWAYADSYEALHSVVKSQCMEKAMKYRHTSFRFNVDAYQGKRSTSKQRELIDSFGYLDLRGPIVMEGAELQMCIFEDFIRYAETPKAVYLGRWISNSGRDAVAKFDLKKRAYISRTSMDAELSLVTANLNLAAPGKLIFDPFVGTGSFSVTSAYFGAMTLGADIDSRSIRGSPDRNIKSNFAQYQIESFLLDNFICDLTHSPLRKARLFDGIVCDPPYGVREGPKTLGYREGRVTEVTSATGIQMHLREDFIAPKRPYAFDDMLSDVLDFAVTTLVDHGRLSMWMPTANDEDIELAIPTHPGLELVSVCVQQFNKWARRLLTYQRLPGEFTARQRERTKGRNADDVNKFRKKYFNAFRVDDDQTSNGSPA